MRKSSLRMVLVLAVVLGATSFAPTLQATGGNEIGLSYYDECMEVIYEKVITCGGSVMTWGTSSAGAKYKNNYQLSCDGPGYSSYWYEWDGTQWVLLPSIPQPNC